MFGSSSNKWKFAFTKNLRVVKLLIVLCSFRLRIFYFSNFLSTNLKVKYQNIQIYNIIIWSVLMGVKLDFRHKGTNIDGRCNLRSGCWEESMELRESTKLQGGENYIRGCIQKFPDWVDNEINNKNNNNNKHSLRSNAKDYGGKIH
jgi:hypothetical protein